MVLCFSTEAIISEKSHLLQENSSFDVRLSDMRLILQLRIFFVTMDLLDKWRLIMKKGKIIQDIKTNTSMASSYFYTILCIISLLSL